MPDSSFDGCLTDPPYGLKFMGKAWDHGVPSSEVWAELLRVLKPGAILLAFGGTRTHHRLMCAIEDGGFEIRDCLMWLYGSGFPKSLDISKAIDKRAGVEREVIEQRRVKGGGTEHINRGNLAQDFRPGAYQKGENVLDVTVPATDAAKLWYGYGTALKPAWEPIVLAMKPCEGTFAENALKWGVAGLNIDGSRIEGGSRLLREARRDEESDENRNSYSKGLAGSKAVGVTDSGRWPANTLFDEEAAELLDIQTGELSSGVMKAGTPRNNRMGYAGAMPPNTAARDTYGDSGGASRFFYCAKASPKDRGPDNDHPTVKPRALTKYLATLLKPPGESKLIVPYSGSGSEMLGALEAAWNHVTGIERDQHYIDIATSRLQILNTHAQPMTS